MRGRAKSILRILPNSCYIMSGSLRIAHTTLSNLVESSSASVPLEKSLKKDPLTLDPAVLS